MASVVVKTKGGTSVSFSNTPQAVDDLFLSSTTGLTEDDLTSVKLNVMGNDAGGNAKSLWSLDNNDSVAAPTPNGNYAPNDLLSQDLVESIQYSSWGAKIWITADGQVQYDASSLSDEIKADLQHMGANEYAEDTFTYAIRLGNGTLSWATATVRINGVNDPVVITSGPQAGSATEIADLAVGENVDTHSQGGTIAYTDADDSDTHTASFTAQGSGYLGTFAIDDSNIDTGNGGSVGWTFDVDDSDLDYLQEGEHLTQKYDVTIDDGHDGQKTETVTIDIYGKNDAAAITDDDGGDFSVTEDADLSASGTLLVSDADHDESAFDPDDTTTGTAGSNGYGTFTFDAETGAWTYALNNDHDELDDLDAGDPALTDSLTVHSIDGTAHVITVNINGANETPTGPTVAQPYTGTGDPNDFDNLGLPGHQTNPAGPNDDAETFYGGADNDTINGTKSGDTYYGGSGNDTISAKQGVDTVYGGSGSDSIGGDNDGDTIIGGYGADTLEGGTGVDKFVYLDIRDTGDVTVNGGFTAGAGGDKLDFSGLGSNTGTPDPTNAQPAFGLFADSAVHAHSINYFQSGADTVVWADTDGNTATVEMQITLTGVTAANLTAANFVL